jgi:RNA polymerase sigma-70 factor (ECF subfamily)
VKKTCESYQGPFHREKRGTRHRRKSLNKLQQFHHQPVKWQVNNNTGTNTTDQLLVERVLNGDTQAFGTIVKNTENLVARIVFELIKNEGDRKDIAQDIYLKAFQKLRGFKFQSKLSTWIGQISYNTCIDYLRKRKPLITTIIPGENERGSDDIFDIIHSSNGGTAEPADGLLLEKDISEIVKDAIEKLSPVYKTLITLYHNEELSYDEIGQITGLPAGTVKSYLFRARRELKINLLLNYTKEELW